MVINVSDFKYIPKKAKSDKPELTTMIEIAYQLKRLSDLKERELNSKGE